MGHSEQGCERNCPEFLQRCFAETPPTLNRPHPHGCFGPACQEPLHPTTSVYLNRNAYMHSIK
eukprot:2139876-Amphidinium_carterae.1